MKLYDVYFSCDGDYETLTVEAIDATDAMNKIILAYGNQTIIYEVWEH